jgi:hypothetical protein
MTSYVVVVYATHSAGMFEDLIHNPFNVPIQVLGFGEPWVSYRKKLESVLSYVRTLPDDQVVISLDGWDTVINRDPKCAVEYFKSSGADILFSTNRTSSSVMNFVSSIVFANTCEEQDKQMINMGMYMGYANAVSGMIAHVLYMDPDENDDQKMINLQCKRLSSMFNVEVDTNQVIFKNVTYGLDVQGCSDPFFISYPGSGGTRHFDWTLWKNRVARDFRSYCGMALVNLKLKYTNQLVCILVCIIFGLLLSRPSVR